MLWPLSTRHKRLFRLTSARWQRRASLRAWWDRGRRRGGGAGATRRSRPVRLCAAAGQVALRRARGHAARLHALGVSDHPAVPERAGQRHSAGDRRTASDRPDGARAPGLDPHRDRKGDPHPVRSAVRRLRRPRRTDRSGRRFHHVRARPRLATPAARPDPGRRGRRRRGRLQHAAGRHRLRHRGDEPRLRDAYQQPHHCGGHRGRPDLARAGGQLHLFRQQRDAACAAAPTGWRCRCAAWSAVWPAACSAASSL